ncbi:MAG: hypothetical protein FWF90_16825 [Promicromonosporaceae bacterium]|nr:hypothetical protein [Promicromonosporaceae bacterium]
MPATPFERSARFWLNAYPQRWREQHGDELLGVLEEAASQESVELPPRLPRTEVIALVRAGWSLRRREHPPLLPWLGYRMFRRRLPLRNWRWVVDDIRSPLYPFVSDLGRAPFMALYLTYVAKTSDDPFGWFRSPLFWILLMASSAAVAFVARQWNRRRAWLRHVVDGNVPWSVRRAWTQPGSMAPTGTDPAITGEPPEERRHSAY